jgi:hypothetical protein
VVQDKERIIPLSSCYTNSILERTWWNLTLNININMEKKKVNKKRLIAKVNKIKEMVRGNFLREASVYLEEARRIVRPPLNEQK